MTGIIKHFPQISIKKIPALLIEGGFEVFDTLLIFLSNTISYSRIFALALVHLHSLRLHYYECFSKFFKASGVKYQPFKAERIYTIL